MKNRCVSVGMPALAALFAISVVLVSCSEDPIFEMNWEMLGGLLGDRTMEKIDECMHDPLECPDDYEPGPGGETSSDSHVDVSSSSSEQSAVVSSSSSIPATSSSSSEVASSSSSAAASSSSSEAQISSSSEAQSSSSSEAQSSSSSEAQSSSSSEAQSSSSSEAQSSSSEAQSSSSSSSQGNSGGGDNGGGTEENPIEMPGGQLPETSDGIYYLTGTTPKANQNNKNNVQLSCGGSRGFTAKIYDCSSICTEISNALSNISGGGSAMLPSSIFYDCDGSSCKFNIKLELGKDNANNWPSCSF